MKVPLESPDPYAEAERSLRGILDDAEILRDREAQARAHQEMAVILSTGGRPVEAIPHEWQAFELYEDEAAALASFLK